MLTSLRSVASKVVAGTFGIGLALAPASAVFAAPTSKVVIYKHEYRNRVQTGHGTNYTTCGYVQMSQDDSTLRVRTGPGTSYEEIGHLRQYDEVYVEKRTPNWYLAGSMEDPDWGWISADYVNEFVCY